MVRSSVGLAACLAAAVVAGCGTVSGSGPGSGAGAGPSSGCPGAAAGTVVITLAGNAKTYCVRVGDKLRVNLRGTGSRPWLRPLASGNALAPVPGAATADGVTGASFAAVRPGRATMTSVRPPCRVAIPWVKSELEPAFPLPKAYPLRSCPPGQRFSALVIVRS